MVSDSHQWTSRVQEILNGNRSGMQQTLAVLKIRTELGVRQADRRQYGDRLISWNWSDGAAPTRSPPTTIRFASDVVDKIKALGGGELKKNVVLGWEATHRDPTTDACFDGPPWLWRNTASTYWITKRDLDNIDKGALLVEKRDMGATMGHGKERYDTADGSGSHIIDAADLTPRVAYPFHLALRLALAGDPSYALKHYWLTLYAALANNVSPTERLDRFSHAAGVLAYSRGAPMLLNMDDQDDRAIYYALPFERTLKDHFAITNPMRMDEYFFGPGSEKRVVLSFAQSHVASPLEESMESHTETIVIPLRLTKTDADEYTIRERNHRSLTRDHERKTIGELNSITWFHIAIALDRSGKLSSGRATLASATFALYHNGGKMASSVYIGPTMQGLPWARLKFTRLFPHFPRIVWGTH